MALALTTLFVNHFTPDNSSRRAELDDCLQRNIHNPQIDRVVILAQSTPDNRAQFVSPKIIWHEVPVDGRPTFRTFFDLVNSYTTSPYDLNIVSNSDIYFDCTLSLLKDRDLEGVCVALTRWEVKLDGTQKVEQWDNSQDVWIFQGRVKPLGSCDFSMGIFGCDNRLAWLLRHADYKVVNPVYDVKALHVHHCGVRNNGTNVAGDHAYVKRQPLRSCDLWSKQSVECGVIAFSLYGSNPMYLVGAVENAKLARWVYPGWTCRFYIDDSVPSQTVTQLQNLKCEIVKMPTGSLWEDYFGVF